MTDLLTPVDAEFLFEYLLDHKSEFCNDVTLDDNQYKLKCKYVYEDKELDYQEEINFEIQLLRNPEDDMICVDFKRLEGSSL